MKCNLCNKEVVHNSYYPLTQEEKNVFICVECELKDDECRD